MTPREFVRRMASPQGGGRWRTRTWRKMAFSRFVRRGEGFRVTITCRSAELWSLNREVIPTQYRIITPNGMLGAWKLPGHGAEWQWIKPVTDGLIVEAILLGALPGGWDG